MTKTGLQTSLGVTLAIAFLTGFLMMKWGLISPCPQVPDDLPEWAIPVAGWGFLLSPVLGLVAGVVVSRRSRAALPADDAER